MPVVLHVDQEAREEALRHYNIIVDMVDDGYMCSKQFMEDEIAVHEEFKLSVREGRLKRATYPEKVTGHGTIFELRHVGRHEMVSDTVSAG